MPDFGSLFAQQRDNFLDSIGITEDIRNEAQPYVDAAQNILSPNYNAQSTPIGSTGTYPQSGYVSPTSNFLNQKIGGLPMPLVLVIVVVSIYLLAKKG